MKILPLLILLVFNYNSIAQNRIAPNSKNDVSIDEIIVHNRNPIIIEITGPEMELMAGFL